MGIHISAKKLFDDDIVNKLWAPVFGVLVVVSYFLINKHFIAPAYLSDEIAYLANAAALAGNHIDAASSWFFGYSLFLAPVFSVFSNPYRIWKVVIAINSIMWGLNFWMLFYLLKNILPNKSAKLILLAVICCSVYPSWVIIAGYAFSSSAFIMVFLLCLVILMTSRLKSNLYLTIFSVLIGYLYWIHPVGLAVVVATSILFIVKLYYERSVKYLIYLAIMVFMVFSYQLVLGPWLQSFMTPTGFEAVTHYGGIMGYLDSLKNPKWIIIFFGQISYLIIATFGILFFGLFELLKIIRNNGKNLLNYISSNTVAMVVALNILALLGVLAMGSLNFAAESAKLRVDHWIYGRYSEMVILPLLTTGILVAWRLKYAIRIVLFVAITGLALVLIANSTTTNLDSINLVDTSSFWPRLIVRNTHFFIWFLIGILGIIYVGVVGRINKKWLILIFIPLIIAQISFQQKQHLDIINTYSKPSGVYDFVINNFSRRTCIGLSYRDKGGSLLSDKGADIYKYERLKLYSFYLYNYDFKRMTPKDWYNNCSGPYLTYDLYQFKGINDIRIVGREISSGLYIVVKSDQTKTLKDIETLNNFYFNNENQKCVIGDCLKISSEFLTQYTQVGQYKDGLLSTTGQLGYLFYGPYGPYASFTKGTYRLSISANYDKIGDKSKIEILSNNEKTKHLSRKIGNDKVFTFTLSEDVKDLEIRLLVDKNTNLQFKSYAVEKID